MYSRMHKSLNSNRDSQHNTVYGAKSMPFAKEFRSQTFDYVQRGPYMHTLNTKDTDRRTRQTGSDPLNDLATHQRMEVI